MTRWLRRLKTSKRAQGIVTPKHPRDYKCGCRRINRNDGKGWIIEFKCSELKHSYGVLEDKNVPKVQ